MRTSPASGSVRDRERFTIAAAAKRPPSGIFARPESARAGSGLAHSIRRLLRPPGAERLEGVPERGLRGLLVERLVDVGRHERCDRGRESLDDTRRRRVELVRERERETVEELDAAIPHRDDELRLDDVELAHEPPRRVGRILRSELEAVGAVDGERIDVEALQRLQNSLSRATEERDALLDLRGLGGELEEHDVRERMTRAHDRDPQLVTGARKLVPELVDLGDRFLEVPLVDLVGWHGGGHGVRSTLLAQRTFSLTWATHFSDWR